MSVMVMIVLLKLACTWATPLVPTLRSRFFVFLTSATRYLLDGYFLGAGLATVRFITPAVFFGPLRVRALVLVR